MADMPVWDHSHVQAIKLIESLKRICCSAAPLLSAARCLEYLVILLTLALTASQGEIHFIAQEMAGKEMFGKLTHKAVPFSGC